MEPSNVRGLTRKTPVSIQTMPAGGGTGRTFGPFVIAPYRSTAQASGAQSASFLDYFKLIQRRKIPILLFVVGCAVAAYLLSKRMTPVYEATLTIDIDREPTLRLMGPEAMPGQQSDVDQYIATQVRLIQSDPVLRPVVLKFQLLASGKLPPAITRERAEQAPISLRNLKVSRPTTTNLIQLSYRDSDPLRAADITNAIAASYIENLDRNRVSSWRNVSSYTLQRVEELRVMMERSGLALLRFQRELGMVDPEDKSNIVTTRLQELNLNLTRAASDRASRQAAYDAIRSGDTDALPASPQAEALRKVIERRNEALQKFSDVKTVYGDGHPEYRRAQAQLKELDDELAAARQDVVRRVGAEFLEAQLREGNVGKEFTDAKAQSDRITGSSLAFRLLKQKADADRSLYDEFVRKLGEAEINAGVRRSGVRIAEPARAPLMPVSPNVPLNCAIAVIGSLMFAVVGVVIADATHSRIRHVEDVRSLVPNGEVIGTLPTIRAWRKRTTPANAATSGRMLGKASRDVLQSANYEEAIRMLRGAMLAHADERGVQTLLVTSARGQEGRSTVAAQLAMACADLGLKTLLIDGDLRKPVQHNLFFTKTPLLGLSNVLKGEVRWQNVVVRQTTRPLLHVIPAGELIANASELMSIALPRVLEEMGRQCDLVILDSPPFLEYAATAEMARAADAVLVVVRAEQTDPASLGSLSGHLQRLQADILGVVVNDLS